MAQPIRSDPNSFSAQKLTKQFIAKAKDARSVVQKTKNDDIEIVVNVALLFFVQFLVYKLFIA